MGNVMDKTEFSARVLAAETGLYRVAKTILPQGTDCEDAVQETLLRAWEKRNTLRQPEFFRTWLTRILINECNRMAKNRRTDVPLEECCALTAPDGSEVDTELRECILRLPLKLRTTVTLYYIEGYSVGEIAKLTRVPSGTVKSRLSRSRDLLREQLSDTEFGGNV